MVGQLEAMALAVKFVQARPGVAEADALAGETAGRLAAAVVAHDQDEIGVARRT